MAEVQIGLIFVFLIFYALTQIVWVRVIKKEKIIFELHLPLLAIVISDTNTSKKSTVKLGVRSYIRIIFDVLSRFKRCEVIIQNIHLPAKTTEFGISSLVKPFGQQGLIYATIAYLRTLVQRIRLSDNAIISSPDIRQTQFYITVKIRLFQLIYALVTIRKGVNKEKEAKRKRNVGE